MLLLHKVSTFYLYSFRKVKPDTQGRQINRQHRRHASVVVHSRIPTFPRNSPAHYSRDIPLPDKFTRLEIQNSHFKVDTWKKLKMSTDVSTGHSFHDYDRTAYNKKLIRRWDSERELSLRRHRTCTIKYNIITHKFRHRSLLVARHRPMTVFTAEKNTIKSGSRNVGWRHSP